MRKLLLAACLLPMLPLAAAAQPVEGLYVAAGAGVNFHDNESIRGLSSTGLNAITSEISGAVPGGVTFKPGYAALGSIGYGFGNGVRLEVEGDWMRNDRDPRNFGLVVSKLSPGSVLAVSQKGNETKSGALLNALFDMDIGSPYVFPYIGGGLGYQTVSISESENLSSGPFSAHDHFSSSKSGFAYQGILGVSLPIPPVVGLSATVEYRYLGVNGIRTYGGSFSSFGNPATPATLKLTGNDNHMILLGLRYAFNVTPPPMEAAPAPAASVAPAPAPSRSYLVFFDWDKSDLTARAQAIIADAAKNAARVQTTRIAVAGHADKSGTPAYNQTLSLARANNVAAELVRLGVAKSAISISAFGDTKPLVPTAAGVREPQNRRVEIVLQ